MANTKGTSAINSPQGGGALSGLGEKFSPDLFTGTGNFGVPIAVPPGRNGFQPQLALGYSSGNGNGMFGMGWALGIPGVTRKTSKGIPVYDDKSDIFILSGAEDLVPVEITNSVDINHIAWEHTRYRPRTEGLFARIIRHRGSNGAHYWEVRSKDGLISYYGSPDATGNDSCVLANPEIRESIFAWHLSKTVDTFGNEIIYEYDRDLITQGTHVYDQLYLKGIKYAQYPDPVNSLLKKYLCQVDFVYENRPDTFSVYNQGFEVRTAKRCVRIETYTDAAARIKTKTYHFDYVNEALNGASQLKAVRVEGHKDGENEFMPPLEFGYSAFNPQKRDLYPVEGQLPAVSLADSGYELVDLDGNGLPDILQLNGIQRRWPNLGNGKFGPPITLDVTPSVQLGMPGVQLIDADGDGKSDLLVNDGTKAGYFPGRFRTVWDDKSFRPYPQIPSFRFDDPEVRLIDLDGDGVTDVLRNGSRFECFFNHPEKGFYKTRFTDKTFADFSFADPRIRFADMTGDGMQDIVLVSSGQIHYWPNLGYGRFGEKVVMLNPPRFPEEYNPLQILLGDLDGDGLTDLAFVENNRVTLYINQSGNRFSDPVVIMGTPRIQSLEALRVTDLLGTGQSGILWSFGAGEYTAGQMFFLDFTAGNKPYLLQEMNNNMGSLTRVGYGSSVYHYLRDEARPETRWQTDLPFPVLVVNKVEVLDLLSNGKMVTEYLYHHGYWDGAEREFRGFARVDVRDTESFERYNTNDLFAEEFAQVDLEYYTPPTETRNWFYPGPVGDGYGKWFEPDFSQEYWSGDSPFFTRSADTEQTLKNLPRRARRDALRTLRGTMLRSELYALDKTPLQKKPYTVTESIMDLRLEFDPTPIADSLWVETNGYSAGGGYIFFPFNSAQRTTQYERGNDPMHSFSFTQGYDDFGQPTGQLSVGVPRGVSPTNGGPGEYLATYGITEFIYKDTDDVYMVTRSKRSRSYDASRSSGGMSVFGLRDFIFADTLPLSNSKLIGVSINYYDGNAFTGLDYGLIGNHGVLVRSESLVLTQDILDAAYGGTPNLLSATPDWTDYPAEFQSLYPAGGGYVEYGETTTYPIAGWYTVGSRMKYDFHDSSLGAVGLVLETMDPLGAIASVSYDEYLMFAIQTVDALGLVTQAEYDYRILRACKVIDSNLNISEFDFSPLGLLRATAVIGKGDEMNPEGDYVQATGTFYERFAPSSILEYDFFSFVNHADPVWVKIIRYERHITDPLYDEEATIVKVEYSDGFGRLLQTRTQAEDVIFGNSLFGDSGLPADQSAPNAPAVGVERSPSDSLNVTVSGWQVYNNKGAVVKKYEPYFDQGFNYTLPQTEGIFVKTYYDARGQTIRTVNPDKSEQRIILGIPSPTLEDLDTFIPTPWENYIYDANDLAAMSHPGISTTIVPLTHRFTPKSVLLDALGRTIRTTEHIDKTNPFPVDNIVMQYRYDIRGNLMEVLDPYDRTVFKHVYDLRTPQENENGEKQPLPPLYTKHIDSMEKTGIFNCAGCPSEIRDAKGAWILNAYDAGFRPIRLWARDKMGETITLRQLVMYGDDSDLVAPEMANYNGKLYKQYDEAGLVTIGSYDFKGNALNSVRQCISDDELLSVFDGPPVDWNITCYRVDWTDLPSILDTKEFETDSEYDALNRLVKVLYPEDMDNERKVGIPIYNRAGALQGLTFNGVDFVRYIAYNAQRQRLLITYGNNIMTRYAYDENTFKLSRLCSEKYTQAGNEYTRVSGTRRQDYGYTYDLAGNILIIKDRTHKSGISGSLLGQHALNREFQYDPLYRLLYATGRENQRSTTTPWDDTYRPHDASLATFYTQQYSYDKLGNVLLVDHNGDTDSFDRVYNYSDSASNRLSSIVADGITTTYSYDASGNQLQESESRHFEWGFSNNLRCYFNQVGTAQPSIYAIYLYDSAGNRVKKMVRTSGGSYESTSYINGIYEYKTNGTDEQVTLHLTDERARIATIRTGDNFGDTTDVIKYSLNDNSGSSLRLLDINGGSVSREEYYPFGETSFGSYANKRYRFCGKEKDGESGLYYYGMRYYASWMCRFVSVDPLAAKYSFYTPYQYAGNKPIIAIDLDGLEDIIVVDYVDENCEVVRTQVSYIEPSKRVPWTDPDTGTTTTDYIQYKTIEMGPIIQTEELTRVSFEPKYVPAGQPAYKNKSNYNTRSPEGFLLDRLYRVRGTNQVITGREALVQKKTIFFAGRWKDLSHVNGATLFKDMKYFLPLNFDTDVCETITNPTDGCAWIAELAEYMKANPDMTIEITGHTDSDPTNKYKGGNQELSEKRAQFVKDELVALGVNKKRIKVTGKAAREPIAPNDTEENKAKNRRVEVNFHYKKR